MMVIMKDAEGLTLTTFNDEHSDDFFYFPRRPFEERNLSIPIPAAAGSFFVDPQCRFGSFLAIRRRLWRREGSSALRSALVV